jgi:hypothetical protein
MLTSGHIIWGHGHTYRLGKGIECLCYHVPQVDLANLHNVGLTNGGKSVILPYQFHPCEEYRSS